MIETDPNKLNFDFAQVLNPAVEEAKARAVITSFCHINLADLQTVLSRHAGLYAYAMAAHEAAKVQETILRVARDKVEADYLELNTPSGTKPNATAIGIAVRRYPPYQTADTDLRNQQIVVGRLKALVSGLEHRKDMLVQIAAAKRREEDNTP